MKTFLHIISSPILFVTFSFADIINVPSDIDSIQGGIDMANDGDTVLVAPGTYVENIMIKKKNILISSFYLASNNEAYIKQTVIDGNGNGSVIVFYDVDSTVIFNGFTVTNGNQSGIYCYSSHPILSNLRVAENTNTLKHYGGGGLILLFSSPKLSNVTISDNSAVRGGGIYFSPYTYKGLGSKIADSKPVFDKINRCNIYNNVAEEGGDFYSLNDSLVNVTIDTFTVLNPDSSNAYPIQKFRFDILNNAVTAIENTSSVPNQSHLSQNYPNPFNPSTTIEFSLPKSAFVTLKIFNILGKEVATLVQNKLQTGDHTYQFDGSKLSSGVYLYRIEAGEFQQVQKMVLIK